LKEVDKREVPVSQSVALRANSTADDHRSMTASQLNCWRQAIFGADQVSEPTDALHRTARDQHVSCSATEKQKASDLVSGSLQAHAATCLTARVRTDDWIKPQEAESTSNRHTTLASSSSSYSSTPPLLVPVQARGSSQQHDAVFSYDPCGFAEYIGHLCLRRHETL
jgi:hypothetical protein